MLQSHDLVILGKLDQLFKLLNGQFPVSFEIFHKVLVLLLFVEIQIVAHFHLSHFILKLHFDCFF